MKRKRYLSDVQILIRGPRMEEFINHCLQYAIELRHIEKTGENTSIFHSPAQNMNQIEFIARKYHCEIEIMDASLYERFQTYVKQRWGVIGGLFTFIVVTILLSQMIWNVEIEGADPPLEHKLRNQLQEMGVTTGAFQFLQPDAKSIQTALMNEIEGTTWIGMNKNGTTYHFEVVEQTLPEKTETPEPRHLVASKTAVIHHVYAEKGQPVVTENDLVHKNDMLISGFIGEGEYARSVAASGEIWGETWYKVTVELPEERMLQTLSGESQTKYLISLFGRQIPVWGFQADDQYEQSVLKERTYTPSAWNWSLPVSLKRQEYLQSKMTEEGSEKNMVEKTKEAADNRMKEYLPPQAKIQSEKILHEDSQNGKVKLVIHYQVLEDIKSEAPIIQGE